MLSQLLHGRLTLQSAVAEILAVLVIIFLILPLHEWAHAQTAYFLGDKAIKKRGRLSLNPLSHVDPVGALFMLLVGFGWAKPVPVDPRNFKNNGTRIKPRGGSRRTIVLLHSLGSHSRFIPFGIRRLCIFLPELLHSGQY